MGMGGRTYLVFVAGFASESAATLGRLTPTEARWQPPSVSAGCAAPCAQQGTTAGRDRLAIPAPSLAYTDQTDLKYNSTG